MTMFVVIIGWVFFRIEGLREALKYLGVMFGLIQPENVGVTVWYYLDAKIIIALFIAIISSIPVAKMELFVMLRQYTVWKYASTVISLILFFISAVFVVASSYNPFIYFRF
jgi:alginate O-acetyltransferase complex protein AlgI